MITLLVGVPGAGKTIDALVRLIDLLHNTDRKIVHNIKGVNLRYICEEFGYDYYRVSERVEFLGDEFTGEISMEKFYAVPERIYFKDKSSGGGFSEYTEENHPLDWIESGTVFFFDELQDFFHAKSHIGGKIPAIWIYFITHHRHLQYDMYPMTQKENQIEITFRNNAEFLILFRKMHYLGSFFSSRYQKKIFSGLSTVPTSTKYGKYNARYFPAYSSFDTKAKNLSHVAGSFFTPMNVSLFLALIFYVVYSAFGFTSDNGKVSDKNVNSNFSADSSSSVPPEDADTSFTVGSSDSSMVHSSVTDSIVVTGCIEFGSRYRLMVRLPDGTSAGFFMPCSGITVGSILPYSFADMELISSWGRSFY